METIRRGGQPVRGFALGTFLGMQTVEDLDKLIKNKDVEMAAMAAEVAKSADPSIREDWAALNKTYQAARAAGLKAITVARSWITPDSLNANVDLDAAFKGVVAALQPVPMQVTKGSKQDIGNRLLAAGWKPTYQLPFQVQSDTDLSIYQATQPIADAGKKGLDFLEWLAAHKTAFLVGGVVVGGVVVLGTLSPYVRMLAPRR